MNRVLLVLFLGMISLPLYSQTTTEKSYVGMRPPEHYDPRVSILQPSDERFMGLYMDGAREPYVKANSSIVKREVSIDSTGQNINLTEKLGNIDFLMPNYLTLQDYISMRRQHEIKEGWTNTAVSTLDATSEKNKGSGGFRIDIPVEIKNKAFQQIFGGSTVGLDVSGEINIKGGFRNEKRSEVKSSLNRGADNSFKMEQTQRFKVEGHIGDKVTIGIDQDSERAFDFDNNIKLQYEGYEDEIIQSVQAGNISLSLPGTKFVTFGGKSSGLFGIKTAATIGNLKLTAIASQEKGEKKRLQLNGGASEDAAQIRDYQYKKGVYFFIDEVYRGQYMNRTEDGTLRYVEDRVITDFELWKSGPSYESRNTESISGFAVIPQEPFGSGEDLSVTEPDNDRDKYEGYFIRLEKNQDYYLDEQLGFIRLNQRLNENEVLGIAYRDKGGVEYGTLELSNDSTLFVKMLRNKNPRPIDKTYDLEWKNVYDFGRGTSRDGFEMRIFYKPSSGVAKETVVLKDGRTMSWLEFFGLDLRDEVGEANPDNLVDDNDAIINFSTGEVFFPDLRPFDPTEKRNQDLFALLDEPLLEPAIYDTTVQSVINSASNFYIEVNSKKKSSEYSLGMNVIENSEEVTLNGRILQRGTDYTIDYFSGQLVILNEEALGVNANLDVSYESNQLFQIDKKTVMGARAEYGLWDDSFIGATFLYLNESTLDQKVRVGKGPMRNMVWDVNTSMAVKPFFMTKMINLLPFVDSRDETLIKFEGEIAQILPNPNTRNNPLTDDNDGVAYIDDFEASKRMTPITITHQTWEYCSPPVGKYDYDAAQRDLRGRGKLVYFTPYVATKISEIWPTRDTNPNVNNQVNILEMHMTPSDSGKASWNGIMKALSSGYSNQTETKYLELWVKGDAGNVHIDIGQISEDIIPNKKYDTEDKKVNLIRNGLLDDGEDIGMDGMSDDDERAIEAGGDYWDLNNDGRKSAGEPYSDDNWEYKANNSRPDLIDYSKVNGTEGNRNEGGTIYPDTEDLNGNGTLDLDNNYYSYGFSLNKFHPDTVWISGKSIQEDGTDNLWRQYRIPINAPSPTRKIVGNPDLSLVEYIRIWIDGVDLGQTDTIRIAEFNLVGSDWKEMGVSQYEKPDSFDVDNDSTITVSVINTHDNPEYKAPPGVQGEVDQVTQVIAKEQSLVLKIENLEPGETGAVQKTFYDAQSYINYKTFKMFVYGSDPFGGHITSDESKIDFYIRMGADMNNYYEIRRPVYEGWSKNSLEVDLIELSQLKVTADSMSVDPEDATITYKYRFFQDGEVWTIKGKPALTNIRMLIAGVKNKDESELGPNDIARSFDGQVWMNEMRLSNVKKDKGMAMRTHLQLDWAKVISINADFTKQDADFHNVQQRFGTGDNELSTSINTTVQVGKMLPSKLGLVLPVTVNYANSESTPKYIPGTDVEVNNDLPSATLDSIKSSNERRGMNMSLSFNPRSKNFVVKHLVMPLKVSYSRNETERKDARTKISTNTSESGNVNWKIQFGNNNFFRPLRWMGTSPLLIKLSDMKLFYSPKSFTTSHSSARTQNYSETYSGMITQNGTFTLKRNYGLNMNITEALSFDVSRTYAHDMRGVDPDTFKTQLQDLRFGFLNGVDNSFSTKFNPKIFSWFTTNFSYSSTFKYGYKRQQKLAPRSGSQNRTFTASGNLDLENLAKSVYRPGGGNRSNNNRRARSSNRNDKDQGDDKDGGLININFMELTSKFLGVFKPFSISYNKRDNINAYGLDGMPYEGFQFGFTQNTGRNVEKALLGGDGQSSSFNRATSGENESWSVNSGLEMGRNIDFRIKYEESNNLNANGKTTTGQRKKSWLKDMDSPFPGWSFNLKGVEKLPLVKDYFQRISLDHAYTGSYNENFDMVENETMPTILEEKITKTELNHSFRPLVGVNMQMKNGISMNVKYNMGQKSVASTSYGQTIKRTTTNDLSVTMTYSKSGNFRLPLPFLNKKRLKNNIDMSFTYSATLNKQEDSKKGENYEPISETSKWSMKPDITYSFSNRVRGGVFFEIGKTHNQTQGDTSYKEFGINVKITISGS